MSQSFLPVWLKMLRRLSIDPGLAISQVGVGLTLLATWWFASKTIGSAVVSSPTLVAVQLGRWATSDLYANLLTTLWETISGLVVGMVFGVIAGLVLGRTRIVGELLRPLVYAVYSVPLISLAPLFIMFFGLGVMPKIVLVSLVVFFLIFFNTLAGAQAVDTDLLAAIELMGANPAEQFRKVVAPACMPWIVGGLKVALPYALVAATTGEMLAGQHGIGYLLSEAAQKFDMTALYAALFILVVLGLIVGEASVQLEKRLLRWRPSST